MVNQLLPLLVFSTVFERFNVFVPQFDFSLKLSLILLPIIGLILLWKRRLVFNPTFLFPLLVLVILAEAVSIPLSYDPFQSFQVVIFHLLMIGLFYLIVWSVRNERGLTSLVWAWGAGAVVVSVLGFWQFGRFLLGQDPTLFLDGLLGAKTLAATTFTQRFLGHTFLRPSSTFTDVNTAASFVGVFLLLGWGWWLSLRSQWSADSNRSARTQRLLLCGALVVSFIFFVLASSRSAALGLGVGAALFGFLAFRERISKKLLVGGLVLLLSGLVGGLAYLSLSDAARLGSVQERLVYAKATVKMLERTSYAGVGAGNFEPYFTEVIRPRAKTGYSHSIFLTWLGELGIGGLISNLLLIGVVIFFIWRVLFKLQYDSPWYKRSSALLAGFVALVFSNIFHAHYGLEFTWILLGLVVGGYYLAKNEKWQTVNEKLNILGVEVDNVTMSEAIGRVKGFFKSGKKAYIVTPNPEMIIQARKDSKFVEVLNGADLAIPDGAGLIWASRIWGTSLKERVTGTDLFLELCAEASRRGGRVLFLEGPEGLRSSVEAAQKLKEKYPKLDIAGTLVIRDEKDKEAISEIKKASRGKDIDLLFVAYGHGKQERWIKRNLSKIPVKVALGVGGAFDFAAGAQIRAPKVIRALGFEWFYRLARQPNRLKRQVYALVPFIFLTFREALKR